MLDQVMADLVRIIKLFHVDMLGHVMSVYFRLGQDLSRYVSLGHVMSV